MGFWVWFPKNGQNELLFTFLFAFTAEAPPGGQMPEIESLAPHLPTESWHTFREKISLKLRWILEPILVYRGIGK